jgi:hypothetical protein
VERIVADKVVPNYAKALGFRLKKLGRPPTLRLLNQIRELPYEEAAGKSDTALAKLLGADPEDQYLRQCIGEGIRFVMQNFTQPKPGESRKARRDRALDLILWSRK